MEGEDSVILEGKKILVTGVVNRHSIAFAIAERAQAQGAEVLLTSFGRVKRMTERSAARLDPAPEVLELDVNSDDDIAALRERAEGALGDRSTAPSTRSPSPPATRSAATSWRPRGRAPRSPSRPAPTPTRRWPRRVAPLMTDGGALVGLDFDATVAWPSYDWMGVAKAALESVNRYLARDLGAAGRSASTWSPPARSTPPPPPASPASPTSRRLWGDAGAARLGPARRRPRSPTPPSSCSPTWPGRRPAKSSTSTAAPTRSERRRSSRLAAGHSRRTQSAAVSR